MGGSLDMPGRMFRRWLVPGGLAIFGVAGFAVTAIFDAGLARKMAGDLWAMIMSASPVGAAIFFMLMLDAMAKTERANQQRDESYQREREMALQFVQSMNLAGSKLDELGKAYAALSTLITSHLIKQPRGRV